jgi:hypothetical protein
MCVQTLRACYEYRSTREGNRVYELLEHLNEIATDFCELHNITCCTKKCYKHSHYQFKHNSDPIIAAYQECKFACQDIEQVEKYVSYVATHDVESLINEKIDTSYEACVMKGHISIILQMCKMEFSDNTHVISYNKKNLTTLENTKVVHEHYDQNLSLGMPMHPIEESNNAPLNMHASSTTKIINEKEEYDDALDDCLFLLENHPCLEKTMLCEDENDKLVVCDNALIHENPMLLLKSPIYTIEEKHAHVEKCSLVADGFYAELVNSSMICRFSELFLQYSTRRLYTELLEDENGVLKMCPRFICNYIKN